jgi:hypothetical protein
LLCLLAVRKKKLSQLLLLQLQPLLLLTLNQLTALLLLLPQPLLLLLQLQLPQLRSNSVAAIRKALIERLFLFPEVTLYFISCRSKVVKS